MASTLRKAGSGLRVRNSGNSFGLWGPVEHMSDEDQLNIWVMRTSWTYQQKQWRIWAAAVTAKHQQQLGETRLHIELHCLLSFPFGWSRKHHTKAPPLPLVVLLVYLSAKRRWKGRVENLENQEKLPHLSLSFYCWQFGLVGCLAAVRVEKQEKKRIKE